MSLKKLTYVVYYHNRQEALFRTLDSIRAQRLHDVYYEVVILDDCSVDAGRRAIGTYISTHHLQNFTVISFATYTGFNGLLAFLIRSHQFHSEYVTFLWPGDQLHLGWARHFLSELYPLKQDVYFSRVDLQYVSVHLESNRTKAATAAQVVSSWHNHPGLRLQRHRGPVKAAAATLTSHFWLGKVYRTALLPTISVFEERMLYQEFYLYHQLLAAAKSFYYTDFNAGITHFYPLGSEVKLTPEHVRLLCKTIDSLIDTNNRLRNGVLLTVLALALGQTEAELHPLFSLTNHQGLAKAKIKPVPGLVLTKAKVKRRTRALVKSGPNNSNFG